ncbi:histidine kinase [Patiriisocius marinistellae]|uniref:histidine kinase n=1 Tax=Patiriisocius marinistellae TaxID=2494560 RepID=A0A5J4FXP9_9FLAO|nr:ATP-binding protein [Patiriisocius marinistellae]GEQ84795.1 histidine kinase [Patiriisocius marinistellae]
MYQKQRLFLTIVIALTSFFSVSQNQEISKDSLETLQRQSFDFLYANDFTNAIASSKYLIHIAKKQNDNYYTSYGYSGLGSTYLTLRDTVNSLENYMQALEFAKKTEQDTFIAEVYSNIGHMFMDTGGDLNMAIENFEKSLELNIRGLREEKELLKNYINLAWTKIELNDPDEAFEYLTKAEKIVEKDSTDILNTINLNTLWGRYHYQKGDYSKAIEELLKQAQISENASLLDEAIIAQRYLSKAFEADDNMVAAIASLKKEKDFNVALQKIANEQKVREISAKFEIEKYQNNIETAKEKEIYTDDLDFKVRNETTVYIIISSVLLAGLLIIVLLFRNRKNYLKSLNTKNKELQFAKDEAERLSKSKTQFFSTISHELRTPLYGVIGLSSILLEDEKLGEHKDDLKSLKFSADYLLALINDVLMLNKADANGIKLEKTNFSLNVLLKNITSSFAYRLEQNKNVLHLNIDGNVPDKLIGDSVRLSQILMNIVGNAVKFNESGTIDIKIGVKQIKKDGTYSIIFSIIDDGIGIPKEKQETIFEEFTQVENKNYNYQGTGLGLPIVKKLLALHNSDIHLESEEGKGSKFTFTIDYKPANLNEVEAEFEEENVPLNTFENVRILIVDDNKINQKVTQKILESRHFKCTLADDGAQAIDKVKNNHFNLVLMDVHMPNVDGVEATTAIRVFNKQIPIIALTAVEVDEMRKKIMDSGMNDIILKPYDVSQFLTTILKHLSTSAQDI